MRFIYALKVLRYIIMKNANDYISDYNYVLNIGTYINL